MNGAIGVVVGCVLGAVLSIGLTLAVNAEVAPLQEKVANLEKVDDQQSNVLRQIVDVINGAQKAAQTGGAPSTPAPEK